MSPGLFPENLFYLAHFSLHFTADLFCGAAIPQIGISDRFTGFLFDFAHGFFGRAAYSIVCA